MHLNDPSTDILIVDDDISCAELLKSLFSNEGYSVKLAHNGESGLKLFRESEPKVVLLDVHMPDTTGFDVARELLAGGRLNARIVIMSADSSHDSRLRALEVGGDGFLEKPIDKQEFLIRVRSLVHRKTFVDEFVAALNNKIHDLSIDAVSSFCCAASPKGLDTHAHLSRISHYTVKLAEILGMNETFQETVFHASRFHDIGKVAIPSNILDKRDSLNKEEWGIMKGHTILGGKILEGHDSPYLEMGSVIARSHHERWDGSGYPYGLAGEYIPLAARLVTVVDIYDALRSKRSYKPGLSHAHAVYVMRYGDGRVNPNHLDPAINKQFLSHSGEFDHIFRQFPENQLLAA